MGENKIIKPPGFEAEEPEGDLPLHPKEGEEVLVFGTGSRRYMGLCSKFRNTVAVPLTIREVYEISVYNMVRPNPLAHGQGQMIQEVSVSPPDVCLLTREPIESMVVHSLEWEYRPKEKALEILRKNLMAQRQQAKA